MVKETILLDPHFRRINEIFHDTDLARLRANFNVVWARNEPMPEEAVKALKEELFAIITTFWRYGAVENFPRLRAIMEVRGFLPSPDDLDYAACFARGIRVLGCAPAFGPMVAEMALGMALAATRQIVDGHFAFSDGAEAYNQAGNRDTSTLYGETVGFIGFGGLARSLRPLLEPFNCQFVAYDPWIPDRQLRKQGVKPVGLEELLGTSKVIFVLAIPTEFNRHLLNRERLELIENNAVLVLMSRAHLVDFDALVSCLYDQRFRAAIDVFPEEPVPSDHPIRKAPGVVLSAHRAGSVSRDLKGIGRMVADDLESVLAGLPPTEMQVAQPELIHRMREFGYRAKPQ